MIAIEARVTVNTSTSRKVRAQLARIIQREVEADAQETLADMRSRTPVKTGALRQSERVDRLSPWRFTVGPHTPYASFVEYGTHKQAAQPFVTPARERARRRLPARIDRAVSELIRGA